MTTTRDGSIESKLIQAGVQNLREFGYPGANAENILTDQVYVAFFRSMLQDNLGHGKGIDAAINSLMAKTGEPK